MRAKLNKWHIIVVVGLAALCLVAILILVSRSRSPKEAVMPPPPTIEPAKIDPWKEAAAKVEEDRGEPVGRKAEVQTPDELKHYSDRRRFLAVQVAETREQEIELPHDFAELIELIRNQNLVEMEPLGDDYILYGVGVNASDEPFTHFDRASGEEIPLFASDEEFKDEYDKLTDSIKEPQSRIAAIESEIRKLTKRDRSRRKSLESQLAELRQRIAPVIARRKLLESFYKNAERRRTLEDEWRLLSDAARDFGGKSYDLADPAARKQFKVRLLSFIRPEARDVLLEIAHAYKEKFNRPLPITSLVRPEQYQARLSKTNPNATRNASPPHATGLAFDIFYYYMTAAEQDYLMSVIAKMKDDGRVEALRENRNHIHVFAFVDGERPDETLIAQAIGESNMGSTSKQSKKQARNEKSRKSRKVARATKGKKADRKSSLAKGRAKRGKPVAQSRGSRGKRN